MATVSSIFETMEYGPAPESERLAREWLDRHERTLGHFIGGSWTRPGKGALFDVMNPATGERPP